MQSAALLVSRKLLELAPPAAAAEGSGGLSSGTVAAYVCISVLLVAISGLMAGLTLGLLSLDQVEMEVLKHSGTEHQRWMVSRIQPLISHPHFLMVTLLLGNTAASVSLPIFVDRMLNPFLSIIISVTAILAFGEIAPQAVCKRYGLEIGAYLAPLVRVLMFVTFPISKPLALLLDWLLGEETIFFRRAELKVLVGLHGETTKEGGKRKDLEAALSQDEVQVIQGALDMASKTAQTAMTPLGMVFMLPSDVEINDELLRQVIEYGHSRVPVYEGSRENIVGLILVKELVLVDEDAGVRVRDLRLREVPFLRADAPLYSVLRMFRSARSHMAVLTQPAAASSASADVHDSSTSTPMARSPGGSSKTLGDSDSGVQPAGLQPAASVQQQGSQPALARVSGSGDALQDSPPAPIGIITIEDVLEELLQAEIVDETDRYVDNLKTREVVSREHGMPRDLQSLLSRKFSAGAIRISEDAGQQQVEEVIPASVPAEGGSDGLS